MPKFTFNNNTYNVADEYIDAFIAEYPEATTELSRDGQTYSVRAKYYNDFIGNIPSANPSEGRVEGNSPSMSSPQLHLRFVGGEQAPITTPSAKTGTPDMQALIENANLAMAHPMTKVNPALRTQSAKPMGDVEASQNIGNKAAENFNDVQPMPTATEVVQRNNEAILSPSASESEIGGVPAGRGGYKNQDPIQQAVANDLANRAYNQEVTRQNLENVTTERERIEQLYNEAIANTQQGNRFVAPGMVQTPSNNPYNNREASLLREAIANLDAAQQHMEIARKNQSRNGLQQFGAGVGDALFDIDTLTLGISELSRNATLLDILNKVDRDEQLTEAEEALLNATLYKQFTESALPNSRWYNAGQMLGENIPYMFEFALSGGLANMLTGGASKAILKHMANVARKASSKTANKFATKAINKTYRGLGRMVENTIASSIAVPLKPSLYNDFVSRQIGTPDYTYDQDGNLQYAGRIGALSPGEAFSKAYTSSFISNMTESLGGEALGYVFNKIGGLAGKGISKGADFIASKSTKAAKAIDATNRFSNRVSEAIQKYGLKSLAQSVCFNGEPSEFLEEMLDGVANAIFVGDQSLNPDDANYVFDKEGMIDTAITTGIISLFMGGVAGAASDKVHHDVNKAYLLAERNILDFGRDKKTGEMDEALQFKPAEIKALNDIAINTPTATAEWVTSISKTMHNLALQRNQLLGNLSDNAMQVLSQEYRSDADMQSLTPEDMLTAYEITAIDNQLNNYTIQRDYVVAAANYNALIKGLKERAESQYEQAVQDINDHAHAESGLTIEATYNGQKGYLVSGKVKVLDTPQGKAVVKDPDAQIYQVRINTPAGEMIQQVAASDIQISKAVPTQQIIGEASERIFSPVEQLIAQERQATIAENPELAQPEKAPLSTEATQTPTEKATLSTEATQTPSEGRVEGNRPSMSNPQQTEGAVGGEQAPTTPPSVQTGTPTTSPSASESEIGGVVEDRGGSISPSANDNETTTHTPSEGRVEGSSPSMSNPQQTEGAVGGEQAPTTTPSVQTGTSTDTTQAKLAHINAWQQAIDVPIVIFHDISEVDNPQAIANIQAGNRTPGWFSGGTVYIYLPHATDEHDIDETIMHECIAHYGIPRLFSTQEQADAFYDEVWNIMPEADKSKYINYPGVTHLRGNEARRAAADEYLAHLAEKLNTGQATDNERSLWQRFVDFLRTALIRAGVNLKLNEADLNNMLLKSLDALKKNNEQPQDTTSDNALNPDEVAVTLPTKTKTKAEAKTIRFSSKKKTAPETVSVPDEHHQTVVSSADGAKILKNIDDAIKQYANDSITKEKTFIGNLAKILRAKKHGSNSQYATFEAVNGKVFTIRLANHNTEVSTFDNHNESEGISIVISPADNTGAINDGDAHIVEYFYNSIKLRKADGKPLVEILKSIKQSLYSGEYTDTTGLAEREEVNKPTSFRSINPDESLADYARAVANSPSARRDRGSAIGEGGDNSTRFRSISPEEQDIIDRAKANGTYLLAPNGQPTNLNPRQWVQVRTRAFREWFGDWESDPQNASKIIDSNGEPRVVYHQTNAEAYVNVETGQEWDDLSWQEKMEWDNRNDWDEYWEPQDFYTFSRKNARTTNEFDGFFFAPEYDKYHEYGERTIEAFLNIRKPAGRNDYNIDATYNNAGQNERLRLQEAGFDGVIREDNGAIDEFIAFEPNQIKSATDNIGTFDSNNPDIRFRTSSTERDTTSSLNNNNLDEKVLSAEAETNTNPTEAQKKSGNYKKGHVRIGSFDISIEQPKGSIRRGVDANGKAWESKMHNTYGYIRGTEGVDGDHIDVFLANDMDSWNGQQVFVVDQYNEDGSFDEHKVMLGFNDINDAETAYLSNYEKDWAQKHHIVISATTTDDFTKWIDSSHRKTKAFAEYKTIKTTEGQTAKPTPLFRSIQPGESIIDYARAVVANNPDTNTPAALASANDKNKLPDTPIRFRMTRRTESTVNGWINRRTDLTPDEREAVIQHIDKLDGTTLQLATAKWFAQGTIRIPEDNIQVEQAIKVAARAKVDPLAYDYPQAIISAFPDMKPKGKPINPDDVSTLTNKQELPNDIIVYDVDNSEESMRNMREIINTHLGIDANPWCILQANKDGILTDTAHRLWQTAYKSLPRRVAFRNGRLIAFFATGNSTQPTWWDRQDLPHIGIPFGREAMNDGSGRYIYNFFNEETGEIYHEKPHSGNRQDGIYREWDNNGNLIEESHYSNGRLNGVQKQWDYTRYAQHPDYTETLYVDGQINGYQISKDWLSEKGLYITSFATIRDGSLHGIVAESAIRSYSSYVIFNNFVSQEEWEEYLEDHPEETEWFNEAISYNPISLDEDTDPSDDVINNQSGTRFRVVEDADTREQFAREIADDNFVKTYRSMVLIDGELYPPMFSKTEKGNKSNPGQLRQPSHEGDIEQSEEDLSKATLKNGKYYITLIKDNNKETRDVAYNPYLHTASSPLNDQFKEAQDRPNMVTVEMYIPLSELTSGYQANGAHDPVGWKPWPSGILRKYIDKPRRVLLTQRGMVHRIVPDNEVASLIDNDINGNLHTLPTNVFTPSVRAELKKLGYRFINTNNAGKITEGQFAGLTYSAAVAQDPEYFGYNPNPTPPKGGKGKDATTRFRSINPGESLTDYARAVVANNPETRFRAIGTTKLNKYKVEKIFGGIWIKTKKEFAKFASAVENYAFEEDGEGIAYTDNFLYAYYWNIDGQPIPYASVYLNREQSQDIVNQVNQEIKDGRKDKRAKEYFDSAVKRYELFKNSDYANDGNNSSTPNRRDNMRLGNRLLRKGGYYDNPSLYVKTQRLDSSQQLTSTPTEDRPTFFRTIAADNRTATQALANIDEATALYDEQLDNLRTAITEAITPAPGDSPRTLAEKTRLRALGEFTTKDNSNLETFMSQVNKLTEAMAHNDKNKAKAVYITEYEKYFDNKTRINRLLKEIEKTGGLISPEDNYWYIENAARSKAQAQVRWFRAKEQQALFDAMTQCLSAINSDLSKREVKEGVAGTFANWFAWARHAVASNKHQKAIDKDYLTLSYYAQARTATERQKVKTQREIEEEQERIDDVNKQCDARIAEAIALRDAKLAEADNDTDRIIINYEAQRAIAQQEAYRNAVTDDATNKIDNIKKKDFGGLAGVQYAIFDESGIKNSLSLDELQEIDNAKDDIEKLTELAKKHGVPTIDDFIASIEEKIGNPDAEDDSPAKQLWDAIRNIAKLQLSITYECGIMGRSGWQVLTYGRDIDGELKDSYDAQKKAITDHPGSYDVIETKDKEGSVTGSRKILNDNALIAIANLDREYAVAIEAIPMPGNNGSWQQLIDTGWITQADVDGMHRYYDYYLPLKGHAEMVAEDINQYESHTPFNRSAIKSVEGHTQLAEDVFVNALRDTEGAIHAANHNLALLHLFKVLKNNSNNMVAQQQYTIEQRYYTMKPVYTKDGKPTGRFEKAPFGVIGVDGVFREMVPTAEQLASGEVFTANDRRQRAKVDVHITNRQRDEHAVPVFVNGESYTIFFYDKRIADAITGKINTYPDNLLSKTMNYLTKMMATVLTSTNPEFIFGSNLWRDIQEMTSNAMIDKGAKFGINALKTRARLFFGGKESLLKAIIDYQNGKLTPENAGNTNEKFVVEYFANGGPVNITQLPDYDTKKTDIRKDLARYIFTGENKSQYKWGERLAERIELASRLSVYVASRKIGKGINEAINLSKEATVNFDRRGAKSTMMGSFMMFFNATMQGIRRHFELWRNHWGRSLLTYGTIAMSITPISLTLSTLFQQLVQLISPLFGWDDEDLSWDELWQRNVDYYYTFTPEYRTRNMVLILGDDDSWRIPLAVSYLPYATLGDAFWASGLNYDRNNRDSFFDIGMRIVSSFLESFIPSMFSQPIAFGIDAMMADTPEERNQYIRSAIGSAIPIPILQPLFQNAFNYNYMGSTLYNEPFDENDNAPYYTNTRQYTQEIYIDIARILSNISGGDELEAGSINWHPEQIENFFNIFGVYTSFAEQGLSLVSMATNGEENTFNDYWKSTPIASRFTAGSPAKQKEKALQSLFYEDLKTKDKFVNLRDKYADSKAYEKRVNKAYSPDEQRYLADLNTMDKIAKNIRKEVKAATPEGEAPKYHADERLKAIYNLANEQYHSLASGNYKPVDNPYYTYMYIKDAIEKTPHRTADGTYRLIDTSADSPDSRGSLRVLLQDFSEARSKAKALPSGYYPGMPLDKRQEQDLIRFNRSVDKLLQTYTKTKLDYVPTDDNKQ